jgi:hypothetical protein
MLSPWTRKAMFTINVSVGREAVKKFNWMERSLFTRKDNSYINRAFYALMYGAMISKMMVFHSKTGVQVYEHAHGDKIITDMGNDILDGIERVPFRIYKRYTAHRQPMDSLSVGQFSNDILDCDVDERERIFRHLSAKMAHHTMRFAA